MPTSPGRSLQSAPCAVCREPTCRPALRVASVTVFRCPACGLRFWLPENDFDPGRIYGRGYFENADLHDGYDDYQGLEASLRANFRQRLRRLPLPRTGARLLDMGAAFGFAVEEARAAGWRAIGVEISAAAAARASRTTGGRVARADAGQLPFRPTTFAAITLWDTLEHLPDPHLAIGAAAALLEPGGRLVLTTGDVDSWVAKLSGSRWHLYSIPEHLFFYTRRSLEVLVSAHGLSVESIRARGSVYPLHYLVERLRKTLTGRAARGGRGGRLANLVAPVNLWDVLTLTAVKKNEETPR